MLALACETMLYAASGPSAVGPVSGKRLLAAIPHLQGLCRGLIRRQNPKRPQLVRLYAVQKVTICYTRFRPFNVTGQCEGSVKREIKTAHQRPLIR